VAGVGKPYRRMKETGVARFNGTRLADARPIARKESQLSHTSPRACSVDRGSPFVDETLSPATPQSGPYPALLDLPISGDLGC
jgi:hypothetical protein